MSKFIQTQCGSLVNVDSISSIQKWHTEIKDYFISRDVNIILKSNIDSNNINLWRVKQ